MSAKSPGFAFLSDDKSLETVRAFCKGRNWADDSIRQGTIEDAIGLLKNSTTPNVLIVDIPDIERTEEQLNRLADVCEPGVQVVVAGTANEYSFFLKLKEMGIAHYLLKPFTAEMLEEAFHPQPTNTIPNAQQEEKSKKLISVIGTRGGIGATTITLNLAHILSSEYGLPTAVLDPDLHFGTVALALDLKPCTGMREALEKPDRVDSLFMDRVTSKFKENFSILSGEDDFSENLNYPTQSIDTMSKALLETHDIVLVDLPRILNDFTRATIAASDELIIVTELSVAGLRDTLRLMDLHRIQTNGNLSCRIIANRVGMGKKYEMTVGSFEKNASTKIQTQIPYDPAYFGFDNTGKVQAEEYPQSKLPAQLRSVIEKIGIAGEPVKTSKLSKLTRLLKH